MTVYYTPTTNVPYLTQPHVVSLAHTTLDWMALYNEDSQGLSTFLEDYDQSYIQYLDDDWLQYQHSDLLSKIAGQLCYLSFGPNRTYNKDISKYLTHIKERYDGSVLEHASATFLFYGVSRSLTHELVRHRAGFAYSQVSQRYVAKPRFVERIEYQHDNALHHNFEARIEQVYADYRQLLENLANQPTYSKINPMTERLKAIRQVARSVLPNETEAPIIVTANMRAWRHFLEMRASPYAETEITSLAFRVYHALTSIAPTIFEDYQERFDDNGKPYLHTDYRKV